MGRVMNKSAVQLRERHSNRSSFSSGRALAVHLRDAGTAKTHATVPLHAEPLWSNNSLASSEVTCLVWLVQYLIHNSKSVNGGLSQNNPLHNQTFQRYTSHLYLDSDLSVDSGLQAFQISVVLPHDHQPQPCIRPV